MDPAFQSGSRLLRFAAHLRAAKHLHHTRVMELFFPGSASVRRKFDTEFVELAEGTTTAIGPLCVTSPRGCPHMGCSSVETQWGMQGRSEERS